MRDFSLPLVFVMTVTLAAGKALPTAVVTPAGKIGILEGATAVLSNDAFRVIELPSTPVLLRVVVVL